MSSLCAKFQIQNCKTECSNQTFQTKSCIQNKQKKYREAEYVQRRVCFVNVQSSLQENVVFSVCARMCSAAYVIFIMWNSISGLDAWYHFRFNISCGLAIMGRSRKKISDNFLRGGERAQKLEGRANF